MARQTINIGSAANDGTGDSLRDAGQKLNDNTIELYQYLGGDSDALPVSRNVLHRNLTVDSDQALPGIYDFYIFDSAGLSVTLSDGVYKGERKTFLNRSVGSVTVTPTNFGQGTSFTLASTAGCDTIWDSANWYMISGFRDSDITIA